VNHEIYVSDFTTNTVSVISDATDTVVATPVVGNGPYMMAFDKATGKVYVAVSGNPAGMNNVTIISPSTNTATGSLPGGDGPYGIALDSASNTLYITDHNAEPFGISPSAGFVTLQKV
jgi:YVTN family beta-propeller protein